MESPNLDTLANIILALKEATKESVLPPLVEMRLKAKLLELAEAVIVYTETNVRDSNHYLELGNQIVQLQRDVDLLQNTYKQLGNFRF